MTRPRLSTKKPGNRTKNVTIRPSGWLLDQLDMATALEGRSYSEYVCAVLNEHFDEQHPVTLRGEMQQLKIQQQWCHQQLKRLNRNMALIGQAILTRGKPRSVEDLDDWLREMLEV